MKRSIAISFLLLSVILSYAQFPQPLRWSVSAEKVSEGVYDIEARGVLSEDGWHIYDLTDYGDRGPNATVFRISGENVVALGEPEIKSSVRKDYDEIFGMEIGTCEAPVVIVQRIKVTAPGNQAVGAALEWQCCNQGSCLPPDVYETEISVKGPRGESVQMAAAGEDGSKSLWALILEAIAWGLVALLTPCVFPMIPMTVSFFLKQEGEGRGKWLASFFGLSIVALYTLPIAIIILVTYITGGAGVTADIFNWLATHWIPNLLFFIIFMVFAASFFGAFEITLPSGLVNKADRKSYGGGLGGTFFVALTLVLVSFSCTGPIVGSVLIKSTQGQFWEPIVTMFAFSVAFAFPFTLLAFAPSLLKKLPKSGGWLNSVKVVLGFIEIALGFKFLSVADQTYHWGLLDREVYLAIWIVVFSLLGFYLLGKIRFANDSKVEHIGVPRLVLVIIDFTFVVYMIPGMWGAPLKALSGYLPPITTQDFVLGSVQTQSARPLRGGKYSDFLKLPYGIPAHFDYDEAREAALASGKPLLIDFTGHGCVNCREMESRVWSDPRVLKMMKEDYVICALYADDKKIVDEQDWVTTDEGKVLKSLGKINSYFALTRFNVNAQPYYAILDPVTESQKVPSRGYDLDVEAFVSFMEAGLKEVSSPSIQ